MAGGGHIGVYLEPVSAHHDGLIPDFFFEPVKFHLETAHFAVQAFWLTRGINRFGASLTLKQRPGLFLDGFLHKPTCTGWTSNS